MAIRHMFQYLLAQPFPEHNHPLLMAGRAEMPALARKRQEIFMPAIATSYPGKTQMQIPAVQISVNHVPDIGPEKSILILVSIIPNHFQFFKMILHALSMGTTGIIMRKTYPDENKDQGKIIKYQYVVPEKYFYAIDQVESIFEHVKKLNFGEIKKDPLEVFTIKTILHSAAYNSLCSPPGPLPPVHHTNSWQATLRGSFPA